MKIRAAWKRLRLRAMLVNEFCLDCGRDNYAWHTTDAAWKLVIGRENMVLCLRCFDRRARKVGLHPIYKVTVENVPLPGDCP